MSAIDEMGTNGTAAHNFDLKLFGDKVKLEVRPASKESTASSRCALLGRGLTRPSSAVPALSLYRKEENDFEPKTRRPFSADCNLLTKISNSTSTESLLLPDEKELPSTDILNALISEPIKPSCNEETVEQFPTNPEQFNCLLTPGLTTKPPLPKKSEQKSENPRIDEEIEIIRLKSLQFDKDFDLAVEEAYIKYEKEIGKQPLEDFLYKEENSSKPQHIDWKEEQITNKSEKKTDGFLKSLKISHEEIDKCINKAQKILEKNNKTSPPKEKKDKLNSAIETKKSKPKFIAKPITCFNDQTWLEKELGSPSFNSTAFPDSKLDSQTKVDNWLQGDMKKSNFMEILEKVEDLDMVTRVDNQTLLKELPEHDKEDAYDDIVQILEALEAEDKKSHLKIESMKGIVQEEFDFKPKSKITQTSRVSSATSNSSDQGLGSTASLISNASNYQEILSYLDEVDKNCNKSLLTAKERVRKVTKALEGAIGLDTIPRKEDLFQLTSEELCEQITDLHLRLKDKSSSIKLLQQELSSLREQILKITKQTEEVVKQKLRSQKEEHENVVKRHQKFIDQLIADKKGLNQQCETLLNEMKLLEDRYHSNMKAADHRHQVEMKKAKEMHMAGEKIRRERWIEGKTQKIKELTVKSIEPELHSMTLRHQQEISDLRSLQKKELEDLELKSARKTQQQLEALREQLGEERESAVNHEREVMNQRYQKLVESEEKNYQEQRRRLQQEHSKRMLQCEEREALVIAEKDRGIKIAQDDFEEKLQTVIRRHNNEMKVLKETSELEVEAWKNNYRKQQTAQLIEKEAKMREQFRKERDKEIEDVIERLEAEANENRQQLEHTTENRIRRMREKFENEIKELEQSEKEANSRYAETKTKLLEYEDSVINLKATTKQLETQLAVAQEVSLKLSSEKENMKDIVRKEMKDEMGSLQKELNLLKNEKDKELQQVYSRVKIAIAKKDEMLQELSRDSASLQEKCVYLENMLEQQRKEYLIK